MTRLAFLAASHDRSTVGFGNYSQGKIQQTLGNPDLAQEILEAAYANFAPVGHHHQAVLAAQALTEVTKDAVWADKTGMHSAAYSGSPLTTQIAQAAKAGDPVIEGLSPLQRQLARAHRTGLNVDNLSKQFIDVVFNVATLGGLREEALRRDIA